MPFASGPLDARQEQRTTWKLHWLERTSMNKPTQSQEETCTAFTKQAMDPKNDAGPPNKQLE